jgi:hypothetical protein
MIETFNTVVTNSTVNCPDRSVDAAFMTKFHHGYNVKCRYKMAGLRWVSQRNNKVFFLEFVARYTLWDDTGIRHGSRYHNNYGD